MPTKIKAARAAWRAWMKRRSRIGRLSIRLFIPLVLAIVLLNLHTLRVLDIVVISITGAILLPLTPILLYRFFTRRVLWKVRNRLITTYLLMGLSPVVLFGTLGGIAAYLFTGQYATNTALTILDEATIKVRDQTAGQAGIHISELAPRSRDVPEESSSAWPFSASMEQDNHWHTVVTSSVTLSPSSGSLKITPTVPDISAQTIEPLLLPGEAPPAWLKSGFHGIVSAKGHLYICSESATTIANSPVTFVGSVPIDEKELGKMAKGLGIISLRPGFSHFGDDSDEDDRKVKNEDKDADKDSDAKPQTKPRKFNVVVAGKPNSNGFTQYQGFSTIEGGTLPPPAHFYDTPVVFTLPTSITAWQTGESVPLILVVHSRPTLLYAHLFSTSIGLGKFVRGVLVFVTTIFVIIEIFSLLMAFGLARTITRSVADLYRGTKEIDAGHLNHRIRVTRHDQLGALASSFNGMAASISDLLVQQRKRTPPQRA